MPKGEDWFNFVYINLAFMFLFFVNVFLIYAADIKKNWPLYRCNPMYMPFSNNVPQDFSQCVQTIQQNYMGKLLEPISSTIDNLSNLSSNLSGDVGGLFNAVTNIKVYLNNLVGSIKSIFIALIIEFSILVLAVKDMIGKMVGIVVIVVHILNSGQQAAQSAWGASEKIVKGVNSVSCFHPETRIKLIDGSIKYIKDLCIDDEITTGSKVFATMNIKNTEPLYKFVGACVDGSDLFVTGSHKVLYREKFIHVSEHPDAIPQKDVRAKSYCCLITSDHRIKINNLLFWDWEDDFTF